MTWPADPEPWLLLTALVLVVLCRVAEKWDRRER